MNFKSLYESYKPELKRVEESLYALFSSDASLIPAIGRHILSGGGKRIRPLFLLASTATFGYSGDSRIVLAGVIEAIHTASLLHDDVVDSAKVRRGRPTAHSLWGNQVVVLVGDFLYANALRVAVLQENQIIMEHLSAATTRMTEGELLQLSRMGDPEVSEEDYMKIIAGKTGSLISAACSMGGILAGAGNRQVEKLAEFGLKTGMVFQMVDDILDYSAEQGNFGKKLGKDLEEGKITLPLIVLQKNASRDEKDEIARIIRSEHPGSDGDLDRISGLFEKYNTIDFCLRMASDVLSSALKDLGLIENVDTSRLKLLGEYALEREK